MVDKIIKFCLLIFIFAMCSKKLEEPQVLEVINISNTPDRSEYPAIAADSRGYFYVVWEERAPNGIMAVYMTQRPPAGNWTKPEPIIMPQTPMRQPDIAIDKENTIHIVGQYTIHQRAGEIFYTKKPLGGDWSEIETIGMFGRACQPKIAVDNDGNIHIAWMELVGYWPIIYAKRSKDGSWTSPVEISQDWGGDNYTMDPKITVDKFNCAHVIWTQSINYGSRFADALAYTTNAPDGGWSGPTVVCYDSLLEMGISPQIAVDDNQTVHVVWDMRKDIFYAFKPLNGRWNSPAIVCSTSTLSMWPYLAADKDGFLHLIWEEKESDIYYVSKSKDSEWTDPKIYLVNTIGGFYGAKLALSRNSIGLIFNGYILPATGDDNYEIFFGKIPKN